MHNLFVVRTPLQLLSAYILAGQEQSQAVNGLVLINPRGNTLWQSTYCLKRMVTDQEVWHKVITLTHRVARRSEVFQLRERLGELKQQLLEPGNVDQVYLGADREFDNQYLVELVGNTSYARLEDGVWSYSSPDRSCKEKVGMFIWSRIVKLLTGVHTGLSYNYRGGGYGQAATADYLFKPHLLQRPSPQAIAIPQAAIHRSLAKLTAGMDTASTLLCRNNAMVFLGSVFVDRGHLSRGQELSLLQDIAAVAKEKKMQLCYKPHPFEKKEKLAYYQTQIPELILISFSDPIEIFFYCHPQIKTVLAYSSSGLLYADVFSQQCVQAIALFKMVSLEKEEDKLEKIMCLAGVQLPHTKDELLASL